MVCISKMELAKQVKLDLGKLRYLDPCSEEDYIEILNENEIDRLVIG